MVKQGLIAVLVAAGLAVAPGAQAQTANATAPNNNAGGTNQAQQFPSGGTTAPNGAAPGAGQSQIGAPTAMEQQEQKKSDANMQICKGC